MKSFEFLHYAGENSGFLLLLLTIWLLLITIFLVWLFLKVRRLIKGVNKGNLVEVINSLIEKENENTKDLKTVRDKLNVLKKDGLLHVQKLGLTKYNPFKEVGGDHSFSLTLLDGKGDGFVLTGLHTRDRTRIYLKDVKNGKARVELSTEERKSLGLALKE